MQIIFYGSEDIFLTGAPQITFFKIIYKRHTNFAIESVTQDFIRDLNFSLDSTSIIEKIGDLMGQIYVEIELPDINLVKNNIITNIDSNEIHKRFDNANLLYSTFVKYMTANIAYARILYILASVSNAKIDFVLESIENNIASENIDTEYDNILNLIEKYNYYFDQDEYQDITHNLMLANPKIYFKHIVNKYKYDAEIIFNNILDYLRNTMYDVLDTVRIILYNFYQDQKKKYESFKKGTYTERYKSAWVEELGHSIIDYVDIQIGNQKIDKHTGDWLGIFSKLNLSKHHSKIYDKMIGNVNNLTSFDDIPKKNYKIIIPLQFWFCRNIGLAIPLISMRHHDVSIEIKLKDLSQVFYIEDNESLNNMDNIQNQYNINIPSAKLYVNYIYLDTDERLRFAKSSHEYLIETVSTIIYENAEGNSIIAHLDYYLPTKYIVWSLQPRSYRFNKSGKIKCQYNNYGYNIDKTGHPVKNTRIRINSYDLTSSQYDPNYYNKLQAYSYFLNALPDGLYVYSFSLNANDHQPSGTINISRIDNMSLTLDFSDGFIEKINESADNIFLQIYAVSYNILRIMSGMGGLAFQGKKI